jgi:hypothetical protein
MYWNQIDPMGLGKGLTEVVTKAPDGKLILAEEIQMGHVGASACSHYRCFV